MSLCRRTVEDRLPLGWVPLACTFGSPLDLHVRQSLSLQGPVDLEHHRVELLVAHQQWLSMIVHNFTVHPGAVCSTVAGGGGAGQVHRPLCAPWNGSGCAPPPRRWSRAVHPREMEPAPRLWP